MPRGLYWEFADDAYKDTKTMLSSSEHGLKIR